MANVYIKDEVGEKLDEAITEYNKTHAPTDRSGYIEYLLSINDKTKKKKE